MKNLITALTQIIKVFHDMRAYVLMIPCGLVLYFTDPVIFQTWIQWGAALPVIAGVMLLLRKIVFNTVDLSAAIDKACETSSGAATVFLGIAIFCSTFLIAATLWLSH